MRRVFGCDLYQTIVTVAVACLIAAAVSTMIGPSSADTSTATSISVNRAMKGDRLPLAETHREKRDATPGSSKSMPPASTNRTLLACDPMFSASTDQARAPIYRSCDA